jgi:hypothetical protein
MVMNYRKLALACALVPLAGCASIVNGTSQSVSVETRTDTGPLTGANCKLLNNKGTWFVTTPGSAVVNRSYEDLSVRCEMAGNDAGAVTAKSSTKAMAFGNILFGGVIGAGVDVATGAAYDYPPLVVVTMGKTLTVGGPASAASAPAAAASAPAAATSAPAAAASAPATAGSK